MERLVGKFSRSWTLKSVLGFGFLTPREISRSCFGTSQVSKTSVVPRHSYMAPMKSVVLVAYHLDTGSKMSLPMVGGSDLYRGEGTKIIDIPEGVAIVEKLSNGDGEPSVSIYLNARDMKKIRL